MLQKSQLIAALDGITDIILIMDVDHNIVFANKTFCEFYEIENLDEIIGKNCYRIIHNRKERCEDCPTEKTLKSGCVETIEKELRGDILKYWTYPIYNKKNTIKNIVSYSRIITDQKKAEQELIQSEKFKGIGQLAAGVAHELNNSLCALLGFSELLKESVKRENPLRRLVNGINESVNQTKKLVQGLLDYSRQSVSNTDYCNICDVVTHAITLVKYNLRMKKINVEVKYEKHLPKVKMDMPKTVQAFINIIMNAIDAMPEQGTLIIDAHRYGEDFVSVNFDDNGCGIPEEIISQIFNPFFTTKELGKGTGLGLSIAHSIIDQQQGKIEVESELGRGSTFEVLLPIEI